MPSERARLIALLDELQVAERVGAEAVGRWVAGSCDPHLRGGLRVIVARDVSHAALAEARLVALGGRPGAAVRGDLVSVCNALSAPGVSDRSKLAILLARFPARMTDPFAELIRGIEDDGETRALLETIGDDDRMSLRWLHEASERPEREAPPQGRPPEFAARFLDALRAAEAAAVEVFGAWIATCALAGLRGGLYTIAAREATHASLLAERLRELGVAPSATLAGAVRDAALARFGSPEVSDEAKLVFVLARYPDEQAAAAPLIAMLEWLDDDLETRELLRQVAAAEDATVKWLRAYRGAMTGRSPGVIPKQQWG